MVLAKSRTYISKVNKVSSTDSDRPATHKTVLHCCDLSIYRSGYFLLAEPPIIDDNI